MSAVIKSFGKGLWVVTCLLAVLLGFTRSASAQASGTILGSVKDASGGVVAGVSVTVTNSETGSIRTGTTGVDGAFRFPALQVGTYEIRVEQTGFQQEVRRGLVLSVGQEAVQNFTLQVGAVEQTVAVTAEAPLIETTTAVVSGLVSENQVRDLPLNARNLIELGTLFPGVTINKSGGQGVPNGFATKLSILGTRFNSSLFQMDGQDINDNTGSSGSAAGIMMGVETVREFNVITSGYSAEYGRHSGGVFNAVTKSGTNEIHGSVFEFLRNDQMDTNKWEQNANPVNGKPLKPEYKRNQYGFAVGGPIKHDQTFFFGSYEALKDRLGTLENFNVPNNEMRTGIVPLNGNACTVNTVGGTQLGPDRCQIPVAAAIRPYLETWPLANGPDLVNATTGARDGRATYVRTHTYPTNENFYTAKVDHRISDKDSIFGRFTFDDAEKATSSGIAWFSDNSTRTQYAAISETRLFSPQVINVLVLGYNRSRITTKHSRIEDEKAFPLQSFTGIAEPVGTIATGNPALSGLGGGGFVPTTALLNQYQVKDDVFYNLSTHSVKFGGNFQRMQLMRHTFFNGGGSYTYNSLYDFLQNQTLSLRNTNVNNIPIGVQDGARNYTGMSAQSDPNVYPRQSLFGFYIQDDWRVSQKLTMNIGLRYEFTTTPTVLHERYSNFHDFYTPGKSYPQDFTLGNPPWVNPSLKNIAPRFGFAWDPTGSGKTSLRGGVGIFHDQVLVGPLIFSFVSTPPYFANADLDVRAAASGAGIAPKFPDTSSQAGLLSGRPQTEPIQYNLDQPVIYKWSFDIQRSLTQTLSLEAGYSGNRGLALERVILTNASPTITDSTGRLYVRDEDSGKILFPTIGRVRPKVTDGMSNYHALRLSLNQRFARGLQMRGSYTFSKALDTGSNFAGSSDFSNDGSPRYLGMQEKGPSAFDIRNSLTVNFTYDLPGKNMSGIVGHILGGWQTSGIVTAQSGSPFQVSTGFTPNKFNTIGGFPDRVAGAKIKYDTRNPDAYFDPSAFTVPGLAAYPTTLPFPVALPYLVTLQDGTPTSVCVSTPQITCPGPNVSNYGYIGNLGRGVMTAPGNYVWNFVLAKRFPISLREGMNVQFRWELYNLMNRPNFSSPNATLFDNTTRTLNTQVGRITSTDGTAREMQFGLKIEF